ncbi:MAG: DUF6160 family protein [Desulfobacteraceae bacterium]|nr:DUF6160 family protein [Desulfobacteraceae bacterium]
MKRLTAILVAGLFVLAPLSASAMEMMSDSNMKDVTGQAGVSISIDDVVLEQWVGETRYTDTDGFATAEYNPTADAANSLGYVVTEGTSTSVVISDQHKIQDIQAITSMQPDGQGGVEFVSPGNLGLTNNTARYNYDGSGDGVADTFKASALTIDVGTCEALTAGKNYNLSLDMGSEPGISVAGVVIGLPTVEINTSASTQTIGIAQAGAVNDGKNFITIEQGASTMHVLGGTLEIAPH